MKEENREALSKVVPVYGDITQLRLGMHEEDMQRLSKVAVAFHLAASVRFDDPLKDAIKTNICSTQEMFEVLKSACPKIRAVVHVSTAYSNPEIRFVEEKVSQCGVAGLGEPRPPCNHTIVYHHPAALPAKV